MGRARQTGRVKTCPACGHENLNVYGYCQACGRGFAELADAGGGAKGPNPRLRALLDWLCGRRPGVA